MIVLIEIGEDGSGCMRKASDPPEDIMTWARLMTTRKDGYWGQGRGHELVAMTPVEQNSLFDDSEDVDVIDAVHIPGEPAVWIVAAVDPDLKEIRNGSLNPGVIFVEGLP